MNYFEKKLSHVFILALKKYLRYYSFTITIQLFLNSDPQKFLVYIEIPEILDHVIKKYYIIGSYKKWSKNEKKV